MDTKTMSRLRPVVLIFLATLVLAAGAQALAAELGEGDETQARPAPVAPPQGPRALPDRSDSLALEHERAPTRHRPAVSVVKTRSSAAHGAGSIPLGSGSANWIAIAACESGGQWDLNTGNGYWGGLQFSPGTWFGNGGGPFDGAGPFPYSAGEQVAVAERVLASQGWSAWPHCFVGA